MKTFYPGQLVEYKTEGRHGSWYSARYVRAGRPSWHWITAGQLKHEVEVPARRLRATIRWEADQ